MPIAHCRRFKKSKQCTRNYAYWHGCVLQKPVVPTPCTEVGLVTRNNNKLHKLAKEIDTNTATVDRLNKEIAEANKRIEESDAEIADLNKAQQDADDQRAKEATEYASAKADDKKAIEVLGTSMKVLQDFYTNNGLSFVQAPGEGGEAPTPPPTTWGSDGCRRASDSNRIRSTLQCECSTRYCYTQP